VKVSGSVSLTASFTSFAQVEQNGTQTPAPAGSTCADYARGYAQVAQHGGGTGFDPPVLHTATVAQHNLFVSASLTTGYTGPGTYDSKAHPALTGTAVDGLVSGPSTSYTIFRSQIKGSSVLTVAPDGSGRLDIINWGTDEVRGDVVGGVSVDGYEIWTCR